MADDSALTDMVRRAAQANAKLYKGWMDLTVDYMRALSEIFGGAAAPTPSTPTQEMDAGASTLVLEGEVGSAVTGSFLVSNDLDRPISCTFTYSEFADPTGMPAKVRASFSPAALELAPGEQRVVQVSVTIDDVLRPGVGYAGEIAIAGMDGFAVPVVLRRQHAPEEGDAGREDGIGEPDTASTAKGNSASSTERTQSAAPGKTRSSAGARTSAKAPKRKTERRR